jgi:hypothetical protein
MVRSPHTMPRASKVAAKTLVRSLRSAECGPFLFGTNDKGHRGGRPCRFTAPLERTVTQLSVCETTVAPSCPIYQQLIAQETTIRSHAKGVADYLFAARLFDNAIAVQRARFEHIAGCTVCLGAEAQEERAA